MNALSPAVIAVCRKHWTPAAARCQGCPLERECGTWAPTTLDGVRAYTQTLNAAAERVTTP